MKKIFISCIAGALATLCGCDSLDMESVSTITDAGYWRSADQAVAFNTALHYLMRDRAYTIFLLGEARADIYGDNPFGGEATQGIERLPYNTINAEFTGVSDFAGLYQVINQVNLMIHKIEGSDILPAGERGFYLGSAYGMRAYLYFNLLRSWGDVILVTEPTSGAGLDIANLAKAASPATEVMAQIKKDIEASEQAFADDNSYRLGKYRWSKPATLALKGEVYLWSGNLMGGGPADLNTAKTALIQAHDQSGCALEGTFADVFSYENKRNREIIFAYHHGQDDDYTMWNNAWQGVFIPQKVYMGGFCDKEGTPFLEIPGYNLNGVMRMQAKRDFPRKVFRESDTRREETFTDVYQRKEDGSVAYVAPIPNKFKGVTLQGSDARQWYDDYPVYRYADVLLLLAYAKALLGEDISTEINAVRERAYGTAYFRLNQATLAYPNDRGAFYEDNPFVAPDDRGAVETVLKERLREFVFEGKRWYDIRLAGDAYALKYSSARKERLLWPVNESALTNNPALKQTPGY